MPAACDLLIDGGLVLTFDPEDRVIADGAVAITADRIVAVETAATARVRFAPHRRIDAFECQRAHLAIGHVDDLDAMVVRIGYVEFVAGEAQAAGLSAVDGHDEDLPEPSHESLVRM